MASHTEAINDIIADIDKSANQPLTVLVCGECKRGKSTFINAWLGEELCPVDIGVCTAVVTIIKYGQTPKVHRYYGDFESISRNESLQVEEFSFDKIENLIAVGKSSEDTHIVEIEIPNEKLKSGLTIIDTPGVGGLNPAHGFLTNQFIKQADIILFAIDTMQPITESEVQYFIEQIHPLKVTNTFILNKCDLVEDPEPFIKDVKSKVASKANVPRNEIAIYPVSVFEEKGLDVIEKSIPRNTLRQVKIFKEKLLQLLQGEIETQQVILNQKDENAQSEQQRLNDLLQDLNRQIQDWSNPNSSVRLDIQAILSHSQNDAISHLQNNWANLTGQTLNNSINAAVSRADGKTWIVEEIQKEVDRIGKQLNEDIEKTITAVSQNESLKTVFRYKAQGLTQMNLNPSQIKETEMSFSQRVAPWMQGAGLATMVSYWAAPWIGIPLGLIMAVSARTHAGAGVESNDFRQGVATQLQSISLKMSNYANTTFGDIGREVYLAINEILNSLKKQAERAKNDLIGMHNNAAAAAQKKRQAQINIGALNIQMQTLKVIGGMD